jgi:hypothetical protein
LIINSELEDDGPSEKEPTESMQRLAQGIYLLKSKLVVQIELTEERELKAIYYDQSSGQTVETGIKELV